MDTQTIELIARNRLIDEILRAGLEVALPIRDRGVDLIAYADLETRVQSFVARPIQMKAATTQSFGLYKKYAKLPNLILAYVWNLQDPEKTITYALTYNQALRIADTLGWTKTGSWQNGGGFTTQRPSRQIIQMLETYRMTPELWWKKITSVSEA